MLALNRRLLLLVGLLIIGTSGLWLVKARSERNEAERVRRLEAELAIRMLVAWNRATYYDVTDLLDAGASIHTRDRYDERSLLMYAAIFGDLQLFERALRAGVDVNLTCAYGRTALWYAVAGLWASPSAQGYAGGPPAVVGGHPAIVERLIEAGADLELGWKPLTRAAATNEPEIARLLIEHGAEVDGGGGGVTPLMCASREGHVELVQLLLEYGADVDVVFEGKNALQMAEEAQHADIVALLRARGARHPVTR